MSKLIKRVINAKMGVESKVSTIEAHRLTSLCVVNCTHKLQTKLQTKIPYLSN
jgi:hypothetical protein